MPLIFPAKNDDKTQKAYQKNIRPRHFGLPPYTYIGSIEKHSSFEIDGSFVVDDRDDLPIFRVPGLYEAFNAIIAADNKKQRDLVEVVIDVEKKYIVVGGNYIRMELHHKGDVYDQQPYMKMLWQPYMKRYCLLKDELKSVAIEISFTPEENAVRMTGLKTLEQQDEPCDFELTLFSVEDLERSIPSLMDGLNRDQRKILFCCFKLNYVTAEPVARLAGSVLGHSRYHSGLDSAAKTIIRMAQDFVESNNINFLEPKGQFGTRISMGADSGKIWHIYTRLSPITRYLFPKEDDSLLVYWKENDQYVEPSFYVPVIPTVLVNGSKLVNGSEGFGPRWNTFIPSYNPRHIVAYIECLLKGDPVEPLHPWYDGFKGTIQKSTTEEGIYTAVGRITRVNKTTLRITELPIGRWPREYRKFLVSKLIGKNTSQDPFIKDFKDYCDATTVRFDVILSDQKLVMASEEALLEKFCLTKTFSTSDMYLFDSKGTIKKYDSPEQILKEFYDERLKFYEERKKVLLENLESEIQKLEQKLNFMISVSQGKVNLISTERTDQLDELVRDGFITLFPKKTKVTVPVVAGASNGTEESDEISEAVKSVKVNSMDCGAFTVKVEELCVKVEELRAEKDQLVGKVCSLTGTPLKTLWSNDLKALIFQLDEQEELDKQAEERLSMSTTKVVAAKDPMKNTDKVLCTESVSVARTSNSSTMEMVATV